MGMYAIKAIVKGPQALKPCSEPSSRALLHGRQLFASRHHVHAPCQALLSAPPPLALQVHLGNGVKWSSAAAYSHGSTAYLGAWVAVQPAGAELLLRVRVAPQPPEPCPAAVGACSRAAPAPPC